MVEARGCLLPGRTPFQTSVGGRGATAWGRPEPRRLLRGPGLGCPTAPDWLLV